METDGDREATFEEGAQAVREILGTDAVPIMIRVTAQEIGVLYASHASPYAFNQFLLERLKAAGAPVEGVLNLRLAHGRLARCRPTGGEETDGGFDYAWMPDEWVAKLQEYQRWAAGTAQS